MRHEVFQALIWAVIDGGKSDPLSTTHETVLERGGGEKNRAPRAAYEPAPPKIS